MSIEGTLLNTLKYNRALRETAYCFRIKNLFSIKFKSFTKVGC